VKLIHHGRKEDVCVEKQLERFEGSMFPSPQQDIHQWTTIFYPRYAAAVINLQALEPRKDADTVEGLDRVLRFDLGEGGEMEL
jgi:hypothetical protein